MRRAVNFFKRYIYKHPLYVAIYGVAYYLRGFSFKVNFYKDEQVANLLQKGYSLIRLGDGEANIILDLRNIYHNYDVKLKKMLLSIIKGYHKDSGYILAVPKFIKFSNKELRSIGKLNVWLPFKIIFLRFFQKNIPYLDSHSFYYDSYFKNVVLPVFKDKKIFFITNNQTINKQKNNPDFLKDNVFFIVAPDRDALNYYGELKKEIDLKLFNFSPQEVVLLFAVGPVGKYLIWEYTLRRYQGIDIGKFAEVMFTKESIQYLV